MAAPTRRQERVEHVLIAEISDVVRTRLHDPRLQRVSLTRVQVSRDLQSARVLFSMLGGGAGEEEACDALNHAAGHIRRLLYRSLPMKTIPTLQFESDTTLGQATRVEELLQRIQVEERAPADD